MKTLAEQELGNPCIACGGAAHPASGMELPSGKIICGPCVRDFHSWITTHSKKGYRVGPKGGKETKYIPFPTGIVKEGTKTMNLDTLLKFLKEEKEVRTCGKDCLCKECQGSRLSEQADSVSEPKPEVVIEMDEMGLEARLAQIETRLDRIEVHASGQEPTMYGEDTTGEDVGKPDWKK